MKKIFCFLHCILLLFAIPAVAQTRALPDEITALIIKQQDDPAEIQDYILLNAPDGKEYLFTLSVFGSLNGWKKDGDWQAVLQTGTFDVGAERLQIIPTSLNKAMGFDIIAPDTGKRLSYSWNGTSFSISGWRDPDAWTGRVFAEGLTLHYLNSAGQQEAAVTADDALTLYGWVSDWGDKPATPDEGKARAALQRSAVQSRFDGWTMASFEAFNNGNETQAGYFRLQNGLITVRRAVFRAGQKEAYRDTIAVPLSEALLKKLQSGSFDGLIDTSGYGSTFLAEDALDLKRLPIPGKVLQNDLQSGCLLLMCDEKEGKYLYTVRPAGQAGWHIQKSCRLPDDASLDLFHTGDGAFSLQWQSQHMQAQFRDTGDDWLLSWCMADDKAGFFYRVSHCGVSFKTGENSTVIIGDFALSRLSDTEPALLPRTPEAIRAAMDTSHWAAVSNPDPKDRLHLRVLPDRNADSLGKCWNGTPVRVLGHQGDWTKVRVGSEQGGLTGWMMSKYLAFGRAASSVKRAFPDKVAVDGYTGKNAFRDIAQTALSPLRISESFSDISVIGVVNDQLFLLLDESGNVGYVPQSWLFDGNG